MHGVAPCWRAVPLWLELMPASGATSVGRGRVPWFCPLGAAWLLQASRAAPPHPMFSLTLPVLSIPQADSLISDFKFLIRLGQPGRRVQIGPCCPQKPDTSCWGEGNTAVRAWFTCHQVSRDSLFSPLGMDLPAALTLEANKLCRLGTLVPILQGVVYDQLSSHLGLESEHSHPG